jgi:hypothetical protein
MKQPTTDAKPGENAEPVAASQTSQIQSGLDKINPFMTAATMAAMTFDEIMDAVYVLRQMKRHIRREARNAIVRSSKWFLSIDGANAIKNEAARQMAVADEAIRSLKLWASTVEPQPEHPEHPQVHANTNAE